MAVLAGQNPTLIDVAKTLDPNGNVDQIVEILKQKNPILEDMTWVEGNLPTGMRHTIRTGLPTPTWRKLYGGVQPTKGTTEQVTDNTGMLESYAEVDKALVDLNGNTAAYRLSQDKAHIQGMSHEMASTFIYGNEGDTPESFTGLAPRFNVLSTSTASDKPACAENVLADSTLNGSGSVHSSIYLCVHSEETVHGIYPKGSKAGLQSTDKGQVTIENADGEGGRMEAYRTHYRWDAGLTVKNWQYVVRICNIDIASVTTTAKMKALLNLMIEASERIPELGIGRPVWYMNRSMRTLMRKSILDKIGNNLTWETVEGKRVLTFDDIKVERTDALTKTETLVA